MGVKDTRTRCSEPAEMSKNGRGDCLQDKKKKGRKCMKRYKAFSEISTVPQQQPNMEETQPKCQTTTLP